MISAYDASGQQLGVSEVSGSTEAESPPSTEYSSPEDLATMKNELSTLFEQMFTKANIEVDEYIQANISPALTIPMELVLTAPRVRKICGDVNVVRDVLSECKIVSIEDDRVKLHVKLEQNTIILRNIPQNTDDQKIKDIFESAENCPVLTGVRSDIGDTWFVTFETEDDAKAALLAIGSSKFEGQPIKGRLKTESIAKAFLSSPSYRSPGGGAMNPEGGARDQVVGK